MFDVIFCKYEPEGKIIQGYFAKIEIAVMQLGVTNAGRKEVSSRDAPQLKKLFNQIQRIH